MFYVCGLYIYIYICSYRYSEVGVYGGVIGKVCGMCNSGCQVRWAIYIHIYIYIYIYSKRPKN